MGNSWTIDKRGRKTWKNLSGQSTYYETRNYWAINDEGVTDWKGYVGAR
jgi:hypothetical protein